MRGRFTPRKKERDRLVDVLMHEHDTVETAADTVWKVTLEQFLERSLFFVAVLDRGVGMHLHGPFPTRNAAHNAIEKGEVFAASPGSTGVVLELLSHEYDEINDEGNGLW